ESTKVWIGCRVEPFCNAEALVVLVEIEVFGPEGRPRIRLERRVPKRLLHKAVCRVRISTKHAAKPEKPRALRSAQGSWQVYLLAARIDRSAIHLFDSSHLSGR